MNGEHGLAPVSCCAMLHDLIDRHWTATGRAPACIFANHGFRYAFAVQVPGMQVIPGTNDFYYCNVPVLCTLDTMQTVLFCRA